MTKPLSLLLRKLRSAALVIPATKRLRLLLLPVGSQQEGEVVWRRGGGAGAFLVKEKTATKEEDVAEQEGELVADEVDNMRDVDEEWDKGNIIKVDGEEEVAPVAVGTGAEGVADGQRRRSANAERDLRSCATPSANVMDMSKTNRLRNDIIR